MVVESTPLFRRGVVIGTIWFSWFFASFIYALMYRPILPLITASSVGTKIALLAWLLISITLLAHAIKFAVTGLAQSRKQPRA